MRAWPWLAVAVAGCGFDPSGATPDALGGGDGQPIDSDPTAIDAPIGPDGDGDGVGDASDNCPTVANADQHNHDGDAFGDACDYCPHLASAELPQPDNDGDEVGDACDPIDGVAQRIARFEGFYDNSAGWMTGTRWHIAGGKMVLAAGSGSTVILVPGGSYGHGTYVEAGFTLDSVATGHAGVVFGSDASATNFYACIARRDSGGDDALVLRRYTSVPDETSAGFQGNFSTGVFLDVQGGFDSAEQECDGSLADDTVTAPLSSTDQPGMAAGLRGQGMAASFDFLIVYAPRT
jgi:hypothetical protein